MGSAETGHEGGAVGGGGLGGPHGETAIDYEDSVMGGGTGQPGSAGTGPYGGGQISNNKFGGFGPAVPFSSRSALNSSRKNAVAAGMYSDFGVKDALANGNLKDIDWEGLGTVLSVMGSGPIMGTAAFGKGAYDSYDKATKTAKSMYDSGQYGFASEKEAFDFVSNSVREDAAAIDNNVNHGPSAGTREDPSGTGTLGGNTGGGTTEPTPIVPPDAIVPGQMGGQLSQMGGSLVAPRVNLSPGLLNQIRARSPQNGLVNQVTGMPQQPGGIPQFQTDNFYGNSQTGVPYR